jgi:hypothetical protein
MGRVGIAVRLAATAAVLSVLAVGQLTDSNDLFPFGALSQYATPRDMDGTVRSTFLLVETINGDERRLPITPSDVGVSRAEVESQVSRIRSDPSLLQPLANAYEKLRPDADRFAVMHLMRETFQLVDGVRQGEPETEELARWAVQ